MPVVSIAGLGFDELEKKLHRLELKTQKTIVRKAMRETAKKMPPRIVENIGRQGLIESGVMVQAFEMVKLSSRTRRGLILVGVEAPRREVLGIDPSDPYYYPAAVEFGHGSVPAYPFIRPAVDDHRDEDVRDIGTAIANGILAEA